VGIENRASWRGSGSRRSSVGLQRTGLPSNAQRLGRRLASSTRSFAPIERRIFRLADLLSEA